MDMDSTIKPVTNPEEAADQFTGEQYMEWVMGYLDRQMASWESLQAVAQARPRPERIKKFMLQRYLAAEAMVGGRDGDPGFLGFAVANLSEASDPGAERALEILAAKGREMGGEDGRPGQGRELWARLLRALGASDEELSRVEAKEPTRNYIAELADAYSNSEWQTAMACFAAQERMATGEYAILQSLIKSNLQLPAADMEILSWHPKQAAKHVMDTSRVLEQVAVDQEGKDLVFQGVSRQLAAAKEFYDGLAKYLHDS